MLITIIIVTYNSQNQIIECLDSISNSSFKNNWNVIIVDNNSQDQTVKVIDQYLFKKSLPIELIENNHNPGFAKAVNQALNLAKENFNSDYFLLLNPDAVLEENCLEKLISYAKEKNNIGLLSAKILNPKDNSIWFAGGQINWLKFKTAHNDIFNSTHYSLPTTHYLTGCCLLIKKQVLEKVGLLDENFFLYYEDADFSVRAQKKGFGLGVVEDALCFHEESQSSTSDFKTYQLVKNGLKFFHQHYPRYLLPYFWLVFFFRFVYHQFFSQKLIVLKAIKDFWKEK